jgi:hypothetical protein
MTTAEDNIPVEDEKKYKPKKHEKHPEKYLQGAL